MFLLIYLLVLLELWKQGNFTFMGSIKLYSILSLKGKNPVHCRPVRYTETPTLGCQIYNFNISFDQFCSFTTKKRLSVCFIVKMFN